MLPKPLRLCSRRDFKRVYQRGQMVVLPTLALYWRKNGEKSPRIGFSVSKKLGGAVQRNRVKRRCRAAARELLSLCPPGYDLIFVARAAAVRVEYGCLRAEMERAFHLMKHKSTEKTKKKPGGQGQK